MCEMPLVVGKETALHLNSPTELWFYLDVETFPHPNAVSKGLGTEQLPPRGTQEDLFTRDPVLVSKGEYSCCWQEIATMHRASNSPRPTNTTFFSGLVMKG